MAMVILGLHESLGAWEMIRSSYPHAQSLAKVVGDCVVL